MDKYLAKELSDMAKSEFVHQENCHRSSIFKCRACALITDYENEPIAQKWARSYVEAEHPMKEEWRSAFLDELTDPDDKYRKQLEESIRWFGVRWC